MFTSSFAPWFVWIESQIENVEPKIPPLCCLVPCPRQVCDPWLALNFSLALALGGDQACLTNCLPDCENVDYTIASTEVIIATTNINMIYSVPRNQLQLHFNLSGSVPTLRLKKPEHEPPVRPRQHPGARKVDGIGQIWSFFIKPFICLWIRRAQSTSQAVQTFFPLPQCVLHSHLLVSRRERYCYRLWNRVFVLVRLHILFFLYLFICTNAFVPCIYVPLSPFLVF